MGDPATHNSDAAAADELAAAVREAEARYVAANPKSMARAEAARTSMPGGNTRSILHFNPAPLTISLAQGCMMEDLDGHRYVDFLGEYSAGLYGHSNPIIQEAVRDAMETGISFGAPNRHEAQFAAMIVDRFPAVDLVRFCNSGSEATLMCLSVARAVTGRDRFIAFEGAYHGGFLMLSGDHDQLNVPHDITRLPYNDTEAAVAAIREIGADLAGVILEPMIGAGGCIPAEQEFLEALRRETRDQGALLIFDEVITSRLSPGGLQEKTGVLPDLTALGKYLGGGLTFGAFGGRRDIMDRFDPGYEGADALYHAGTFNNNVVTMAAGLAGLTSVYTPKAAYTLNANGDDLRRRLSAVLRQHEAPGQVTGQGSIMNIHFTDRPIRRPADLAGHNPLIRRLFHFSMLEQGQYLAPRGLITVSLPMGHREFDGLVGSVSRFMKEYGGLIAATAR